MRGSDSQTKLLRSTQKNNHLNKSLTKSNDRSAKTSLLLYREEPLNQVQLQKWQQKHMAATGAICKPYHQFQRTRLWTLFDLSKKVREVDSPKLFLNYPDAALFQSVYLSKTETPFKDVIQGMSEVDFKKFLKLHRWKFGLFNDQNVYIDS